MSNRRLIVFLSSTGEDLRPWRRAIIDHMRPLDGFVCDVMEEFGARDATALAFCRERVEACDVLVGLIGVYRGSEPAGDNRQRSYTELEYDWAGEAEKSRLMYLTPESFAGGAALTMTPEQADRQRAFRARVRSGGEIVDKRFYNGEIATPDALAAAVMSALANVQLRRLLAAMKEQESRPAAPVARTPWWRRLRGERGARVPPPLSTEGPAKPAIEETLAAFAADTDFEALMRDPDRFDIAALETAVKGRAEHRAERGRTALAAGRADVRAAVADYKRLAALTGFYDIDKARAAYARAAEIDPDDADALYQLGKLSMDAGNTADAEAAFLRLDRLQGRDIDPGDAIWGHFGLGDLRVAQGDLPSALATYRKAQAETDRLAKADPNNAGWQRDLSVSQDKIGDVLRAQGNLPAALTSYQASLATRDRLAKADPGNAGWQRDLAISNERIGDMLTRTSQATQAIEAFQRALAIYRELVARNPGDVQARVFSVVPLCRIATLKGRAGRKELDDALAILKPLAAADRLDANRRGWIGQIEKQITELEKAAAE